MKRHTRFSITILGVAIIAPIFLIGVNHLPLEYVGGIGFVALWVLYESYKWGKIESMDEEFSDIGKVLSLVFHEISSGLRRVEYEKSFDKMKAGILDLKKLIIFYSSFFNRDHKIDNHEIESEKFVSELLVNYQHLFDSYHIEVRRLGSSKFTYRGDYFAFRELLQLAVRNVVEEIASWNIDSFADKRFIEFNLSEEEVSVSNFAPDLRKYSLNKIFLPYFSTRKSYSKKGLGLFLVQKIWKSLGGTISATLNNKKFTLHFYLPKK